MRIVNKIALLGEDYAAEYLKKKGYKIIERNFRKKYEEIDIIATYNKTLVFIEVKTRSSLAFGTPFESIAFRKLRHLVKSAQAYKASHPKLPDDLRIDAVGILMSSEGRIVDIQHLENITDFSL
jgi:putative endonuclease